MITPAEVHAHLNDYVIGQENAKKVISVAVYNHYKRIQYNAIGEGIELKKSNILMIGPTGSGKTLVASTVAKILDVPFSVADATGFTSGRAGSEIDKMLLGLIERAGNDIKRAEQGIIFIDEVDKLAKQKGGESVQQMLLKVIEGSVITISTQTGNIRLDTNNILFIFGGAFVGLAAAVRESIGDTFAGLLSEQELLEKATPAHIAKFGLIPEFIGRIPIFAFLEALSKKALVQALTVPKNAVVKQYQQMLAIDGVDLVFEPESLTRIAELAVGLNTGARGLRTIIDEKMLDIMYDVPMQKGLLRVVITVDFINGKAKPIYEFNEAQVEKELFPTPAKKARPTYAVSDLGD